MSQNVLLGDPVIVVDVVTEPVTLPEVKRHLNMQFDTLGSYEFTDDDQYLTDLIPQCREALERYTGRSLAPKTIRASFNNTDGGFNLPYGPVTSVVSITDSDGVVDVEDQTLQGGTILKPVSGYLTAEYEAGYTTLPAGLKRALLEEIAWRYNHRGDESDISKPARDLARQYRIVTWLA